MFLYEDYKHVTRIQIRFSDIDKINHVNNAIYLNYFETSRVNYFNTVFNGLNNWDKTGFVLARNEINYLHPVHLEDEIYCLTKVIKLGNKSLTLKNTLLKKSGEQYTECANGIGILVAMNYKTHESIVLPEEWIELVKTFEE